MKDFVANDLKLLKQQHKSLALRNATYVQSRSGFQYNAIILGEAGLSPVSIQTHGHGEMVLNRRGRVKGNTS